MDGAITGTADIQHALALHQQGHFAQAEAIYRKILERLPGDVSALHLLGVLLIQRNDAAAGIGFIGKAVEIAPDFAAAHANLGNGLRALEKYEEALACYGRALALEPDDVDAHYNRSLVLRDLNRYEAALASCDCALAAAPEFAGAASLRGDLLCDLGRHEEALAWYDRALAIQPDLIEALGNSGDALHKLMRFDEALARYDRALAIKPDFVGALSDRGLVLQDLRRPKEALASYRRGLDIEPDCADAHFNGSLSRLLLGDFKSGWEEYEWRWRCNHPTSPIRSFDRPLWLGRESIERKRILLHGEQGFGDIIQFCRYAEKVAAAGAIVLLEVPSELAALLSGLDGVHEIYAFGEALPEFDLHTPLLSLPLAFGTTLDTVPADIPYLAGEPARIAAWEKRLGPKTLPRIGLVWSGNARHANDCNRSIPLMALAPLFAAGAQFVSLQNELRAADQPVLAARPAIKHFGSELADFADTAALIAALDLVITVDTSVAHLAGALGKPVWILLPFNADWRWLMERDDSPWYPTARLFRQPAIGEWHDTIARVAAELGGFAASAMRNAAGPVSERLSAPSAAAAAAATRAAPPRR